MQNVDATMKRLSADDDTLVKLFSLPDELPPPPKAAPRKAKKGKRRG